MPITSSTRIMSHPCRTDYLHAASEFTFTTPHTDREQTCGRRFLYRVFFTLKLGQNTRPHPHVSFELATASFGIQTQPRTASVDVRCRHRKSLCFHCTSAVYVKQAGLNSLRTRISEGCHHPLGGQKGQSAKRIHAHISRKTILLFEAQILKVKVAFRSCRNNACGRCCVEVSQGAPSPMMRRDRPNPTKECFAIADWWFYGPVALTLSAISSKLFIELAKVQDSINMSKEIRSAAIAWVVSAGVCFCST